MNAKPSAAFENITPDMARSMLADNSHNRRLRHSRIRQLEKDIRLDQWKVTGDAIKFDADTELVDGQHRLQAIVNTGRACVSLVVRGLSPEATIALDTGTRRSAGDSLVISGLCTARLSNVLASTIKHYAQFCSGPKALTNPGYKVPSWAIVSIGRYRAKGLTPWCAKMSVPAFSRIRMGALGAHAALGFLTDVVDMELAEKFWDKVTTGANLSVDDPEYRLREAFARIKAEKLRHPRGTYIAMTIKAWNARREGKVIRVLGLRKNEAFPSISGWDCPGIDLVEVTAQQDAEERETEAATRQEHPAV